MSSHIMRPRKQGILAPFLHFVNTSLMKKKNIWKQLNKPIYCLAPMSDVTDSAFRQIIAKYGQPDLFFTEFISVAGLCSAGKKKVIEDLYYTKKEKPIIAQIWGTKPEQFYKTAQLLQSLNFDGIDINMGCPEKNVVKQGGGVALLREPELAQEIILATKRGAGTLPISVKTRLGYNTNIISEWIKTLLNTEPAAITIHGRTRKQMSKVPADWKSIHQAVKIRNQMKSQALIIGNGDVNSLPEAKKHVTKYNVDGVMIGRGIFGNPWLFNPKTNKDDLPIEKQLKVMLEHAKLFEKLYKNKKNFDVMKKHFKAYAAGFPEAKELRIKLMAVKNSNEAKKIVEKFLRQTA